MYTQCPDCEIAFRVTAEVLKQAAGKVRCGGCGNAFNALAYLSEKMPEQSTPPRSGEALPELTPEIAKTASPLPQTISAQQSAALLKTLDELAGSDIRIEDTGVEWRVLDEDEAAAPAADDDDAGQSLGLGFDGNNVDEYLDDTDTPVDEFLTATPEVVDSPEIFEDVDANRTSVDELRFDDNTPLPDDFDLDEQPALDFGAEYPAPEEDAPEPVVAAESAADIALSEPDDWNDILGEFEDIIEAVADPVEASPEVDVVVEEPADEQLQDSRDSSGDVPLDMDTQFALQAEAMGIDLSGIHEAESADDAQVDELEDDEEDFAAEMAQLDLIEDDDEDILIEEPIVEAHTIEAELAADAEEPDETEADDFDELEALDDDSDDDSGDQFIPPMTEAEHTVNMQIDQELMALAIEDDEGFASTIIVPGKNAPLRGDEDNFSRNDEDGEVDDSDAAPGFETIIMEGEFVRSALDSKKLAVDVAAAAELADIAAAAESEQVRKFGGNRYGIIGGIVLLVVVLALQAMHQSREALATIPAFSNTVGEVYRVIGQPVQPAWDITGWRFEATKGSTEGDDEELTIYSRLGNNSDGPLPYPLIGISLTDRFEETIGSRILDPAEYLPTDLDPRKLVEAGNTFNAVITIKSTTADATGFKLNVCYRLSGEQLRCAIDDFK